MSMEYEITYDFADIEFCYPITINFDDFEECGGYENLLDEVAQEKFGKNWKELSETELEDIYENEWVGDMPYYETKFNNFLRDKYHDEALADFKKEYGDIEE